MLSIIDNFNYQFIVINIEQASGNIIINNLKLINKHNSKYITLGDYSYANIDLLKNITSILISHRESTLNRCDKVIKI